MDNFAFNDNNKTKSNDVYFSNQPEAVQNSGSSRRITKSKKKKKKESGVGSTYVFFIAVIAISMVLSIYAIFCMNDILAITKTKSSVTISFSHEVKSTNEAIDTLSDNGLIKCKNFCKLFVALRDKVISSSSIGGPYDAGVYYLNGKMGLEGMLIALQGENLTGETVTLTFPEGYTIPEIIKKLDDNDVCSKQSILSVIENTDFTYSLVSDMKHKEEVPYRLEGYLFPDTYEFYLDENPAAVVRKFLKNGEDKYTKKFRNRAEELGLSNREVITIASIIQKEAANEEQMKTISAIIHNRLNDRASFPTLGCQSTSDYITNKVAPALSSTSAHTADYYMAYYNTNNKSTVVGLPAGPICNPGQKAIEAALYPNDSDARFFFHDTKGKMYTARTPAEFKQKVQQYAPYLEY